MIEPRFVYRLKATFDEVFCPGPAHNPGKTHKESSTVFASEEIARSKAEKFKRKIREVMKVRDDYPIDVAIIPMEVIDEMG